AAIVAYNNLLKEFPDTKRREEVTFMVLRSQFLLAENSVLSKKEARLEEARKLYVKFIDRFPESERSKDAESIYNSIQKQQQKMTTEKS
ncbi:MAG: outer membrane protein assembly factor BamD, partial [Bacteroidota bacterium]